MPISFATAQRIRQLARGCRRPGVLVAALLLLGATARLRQYFAVTSYWHDEAYLLLNVFAKSFFELVGPLSHDQAAPPLFLWMLRACHLTLGPSELAMRLPALLASLAALALMAPLAREVGGRCGWPFAVGCAALSSALLHLTYQVKPYTTDVLATEIILLAMVGCLKPDATCRGQRAARGALALAAAIGPWVSFPSVFVTGAACLTLLCRAAWNRRQNAMAAPAESAAFVVAIASALCTSCLALWLLAARHHNTAYQQSFWSADFLDRSGLIAAITWLGRKLIEAGDYGVQGMGIPLALLAVVGLAACWRRQPWLALALPLPSVLACAAAAGKHYPLGNRLLAFLLPCLWLLAAQGVDVVIHTFRRRAVWVVALPVLLLSPAAVYTARYAVLAKPSVAFRQAFAYIHDHLREGDSLWVSQPEVHEVYFGSRRLLDARSPAGELAAAARRGRVWMLCHPPAADTRQWQGARRRLETCGALPTAKIRFVHLDVTLFSIANLEQPSAVKNRANHEQSVAEVR